MSEEPRKRSRFDQTEPEPARKSRFDRRSRSPARNDPEPRRSRSPVVKSVESPGSASKKDAAASAAAAAARINEQINAKKGIQHVDVPPIRTVSSSTIFCQHPRLMLMTVIWQDGSTSATPGAAKSPSQPSGAPLNDEIYQQDGDYIRDIEVNDLRNRYTLTKGSTQKMVNIHTLVTRPTDNPSTSIVSMGLLLLYYTRLRDIAISSLLVLLEQPLEAVHNTPICIC